MTLYTVQVHPYGSQVPDIDLGISTEPEVDDLIPVVFGNPRKRVPVTVSDALVDRIAQWQRDNGKSVTVEPLRQCRMFDLVIDELPGFNGRSLTGECDSNQDDADFGFPQYVEDTLIGSN